MPALVTPGLASVVSPLQGSLFYRALIERGQHTHELAFEGLRTETLLATIVRESLMRSPAF